jgi:beta-mannosidase
MFVSLSKQKWEIKGYWPWVPLKRKSMEIGQELMGVTDWMPATVPGGIHFDLYKNGHIKHPYHDLNSLDCEWVENRWWVYRTKLIKPTQDYHKLELICRGLDYEAMIYLNNVCLGEHEGMYQPAVFDVTAFFEETVEATLIIVLKHAPDEMAQIGKTSQTHTQKSRFNYKWDFSTRLVNIGIWDDVYFKLIQSSSIDDASIISSYDASVGRIDVSLEINQHTPLINKGNRDLVITCLAPDGSEIINQTFKAKDDIFKTNLFIDTPQLWYPNGYGDQPLYKVKVSLRQDKRIVDEKCWNIGIRKLSYIQNDESPQGALPYTFVINDQRIYVRGVNITPLDHLYGNVTEEHYEFLIILMKQANMNMVRVWGGGIIEKECFYRLCDKYGIMVWQEFIQSSSGIDNVPSKRPEFLKKLEQTAVTALKEKRNHVSLTVWSGGNELMSEPNTPSTYDDQNLDMLKNLVEKYDPSRLFLPTSASGPVQYITREKGISHDIHGLWKYGGNPNHYELYSQTDNLFHSEFGVDGLSSMKSIKKFLSDSYHVPVSMENSLVWRHHGEWWDTFARDQQFFGEIQDITFFSAASQWIQAEGLRFILESNRRRKFKNSGSLIWQLNEPWPNVSATNLVDYYGETKMAYHWTKNAFEPIHLSLTYERIHYTKGETFVGDIYAHRDGSSGLIQVRALIMSTTGHVFYEQSYLEEVTSNTSFKVGELSFEITDEVSEMFFVKLIIDAVMTKTDKLIENDFQQKNDILYIFSTAQKEWYKSSSLLDKGYLEVKELNKFKQVELDTLFIKERTVIKYLIRNTGKDVILHIYAEELTNAYWIVSEPGYFTLFPEETKVVTVYCFEKKGGGFLNEDKPLTLPEPSITFQHINSNKKEISKYG